MEEPKKEPEIKIDEEKISNNILEKMKALFKGGDGIEQNDALLQQKQKEYLEEIERIKNESEKIKKELEELKNADTFNKKINELKLIDEKYKEFALKEIEEKGMTEEDFIKQNPKLAVSQKHIDNNNVVNNTKGIFLTEQEYKRLKGILPKGTF